MKRGSIGLLVAASMLVLGLSSGEVRVKSFEMTCLSE